MAINLEKSVEQVKIVLEKIHFDRPINVAVVVDVSASMMSEFATGKVQELLERLLAIGINMDKSQEVDVFTFGNYAVYAGAINRDNREDFIRTSSAFEYQGGTMYSSAIKSVIEHVSPQTLIEEVPKKGFFNKLLNRTEQVVTHTGNQDPTVVFFVTDGETFDHSLTESLIRKAADAPIFWQFIGIGNERFRFLEKLDELSGRTVDNANFFSAGDITTLSDS